MTVDQNSIPDSTQIQLTLEESVVLFELLSRWCEDENAPTPEAFCFESTAEGAVLHRMLADLEKQLVSPIKAEISRRVGSRSRSIERKLGLSDIERLIT